MQRAAGEPAVAPGTVNPYKGLEAFNEADADRFFGREEVIDRLWQGYRDLTQPLPDAAPLRLLPIIGPSGCGKSSLARAGLLPAIARRPVPGLGNPRVAVFVPGAHPIDSLTVVLARIVTKDPLPVQKQKEFADLLLADKTGEQHALRRITKFLTGDGQSLVVLVDQFEEVWSLCESSDERSAFIAGLLDVATDRDARVTVVLTLRSDFLASTNAYPSLSHAMSQRAFLVPAMSEEELGRAIAEPARRANFTFDEATINLMVSQTKGREGALPLLQFALTRIWEEAKKGISPAETLRRLGGVGGALAKEAQRLYEGLPDVDQKIVRRAFLAQVRLGEGSQDSRRRAALEEIVAMGEDQTHVLEVLRVFSRPGERLITLGGDPSRGAITAELTHESLLENWKALSDWIDKARTDLRLQRRVTEAAKDWDEQKRPAGLLWRRPSLDLLRALHRNKAADMTELQIAFLKASDWQERRERLARYGTAAAVFLTVLGIALVMLWRDYANWEIKRPWARLINLSTGQDYQLRGDVAFVGRPAAGLESVEQQVTFDDRAISRIHLSITRNGVATDWRSRYGTTVNGGPLLYARSRQLERNDIIALSGKHVLVFQPIDWSPWHYLRAPEFEPGTALPGWATLVDGKRGMAMPIVADEQFVAVRDGAVVMSDQPTDDSVIIVRRRMMPRDTMSGMLQSASVKTLQFKNERTPKHGYRVTFLDQGKIAALAAGDELKVLTLQLRPAAASRLRSAIREGDYDVRELVLPQDLEIVGLNGGPEGGHGLGEIMFQHEGHQFQFIDAR